MKLKIEVIVEISFFDILQIANFFETYDIYLSIDNDTVEDLYGHASIMSFPAVRINNLIDFLPPTLIMYTLDLDMKALILNFSEPMNIDTFDPTSITLHSSNNNSIFNFTISRADGDPKLLDSSTVILYLFESDIVSLQSNIQLASSIGNTYLSMTTGHLKDVNDNYALPILATNPLRASNFTIDMTIPELVAFDLDLNVNQPLTLTFSEVVNPSSLDITRFTIQNQQLDVPSRLYNFLHVAFVPSPPGLVIEAIINEQDGFTTSENVSVRG